ncbi:CHC2 zinc finger domain-containing protein [Fastidiosipila sanguinis]|uniref:Zinc finger CHC2-type domain-containing protein n=1 Tax=Fastidiosipila sanguinis TaxID=236753 RepID=A0A2S0KP92_9FIRM|nr:CHC2 zinc finger domain-containing protein [Fastidiosipila sanguinis]AVM42843.1 hypothetical protein C5Q98_06295 [Fastidiosipila sanguinis]
MIRAERLKDEVSIISLVKRLGFNTNRAGFISCPDHKDDTPSLYIYDDTNSWYCFACNRGGSIIDFYMFVYKVNFTEAVKGIAGLYGLVDRELTHEEKARKVRLKTEVSNNLIESEAARFYYNRYLEQKLIIEKFLETNPTNIEDFTEEVINAYQNLERYWFDYTERW